MPSATKNKSSHHQKPAKKWVQNVKTVSTFPPRETFNQSAEKVAKVMAKPEISPKGLGSAIRMVQYFINRAGKNLPASQKRELEKAKHLLQEKCAAEESSKKNDGKKSSHGDSHRRASSHSKTKHAAHRHATSHSGRSSRKS